MKEEKTKMEAANESGMDSAVTTVANEEARERWVLARHYFYAVVMEDDNEFNSAVIDALKEEIGNVEEKDFHKKWEADAEPGDAVDIKHIREMEKVFRRALKRFVKSINKSNLRMYLTLYKEPPRVIFEYNDMKSRKIYKAVFRVTVQKGVEA